MIIISSVVAVATVTAWSAVVGLGFGTGATVGHRVTNAVIDQGVEVSQDIAAQRRLDAAIAAVEEAQKELREAAAAAEVTERVASEVAEEVETSVGKAVAWADAGMRQLYNGIKGAVSDGDQE